MWASDHSPNTRAGVLASPGSILVVVRRPMRFIRPASASVVPQCAQDSFSTAAGVGQPFRRKRTGAGPARPAVAEHSMPIGQQCRRFAGREARALTCVRERTGADMTPCRKSLENPTNRGLWSIGWGDHASGPFESRRFAEALAAKGEGRYALATS